VVPARRFIRPQCRVAIKSSERPRQSLCRDACPGYGRTLSASHASYAQPVMHKMNEHVQTSPNKNWDHAGHVQNDGGYGEGEEGEGEREEDPVGHCVVSVGGLLQKLCA
jgi:hypothetical protein